MPLFNFFQNDPVPRVWVTGVKRSIVKEVATSASVNNATAVFYLTDTIVTPHCCFGFSFTPSKISVSRCL